MDLNIVFCLIANMQVNKENCLSPGRVSKLRAVAQDKKAVKRKRRESSREVKKRRIELKENRGKQIQHSEIREGATYEKNIGLWHSCDTAEIPAPKEAPKLEILPESWDYTHIIFDVETTSLGKVALAHPHTSSYKLRLTLSFHISASDADIIQLSAVHGEDQFNTYIMPTKPISPAASAITHLSTSGGMLFHNGKAVAALGEEEALNQFLQWIEGWGRVVLFAHNGKAFDSKRIIHCLMKFHLLEKFQNSVHGFVDTLTLFKKVFPLRQKFTQESLVSDILGIEYGAHDSLEDVKALQQLLDATDASPQQVAQSSFTVQHAIDSTKVCIERALNLHSFKELIKEKVLTKSMATKMAGSGLNLTHVNLAFKRGGREGLCSLLSAKFNGKPRVTKCERIFLQLESYFQDGHM